MSSVQDKRVDGSGPPEGMGGVGGSSGVLMPRKSISEVPKDNDKTGKSEDLHDVQQHGQQSVSGLTTPDPRITQSKAVMDTGHTITHVEVENEMDEVESHQEVVHIPPPPSVPPPPIPSRLPVPEKVHTLESLKGSLESSGTGHLHALFDETRSVQFKAFLVKEQSPENFDFLHETKAHLATIDESNPGPALEGLKKLYDKYVPVSMFSSSININSVQKLALDKLFGPPTDPPQPPMTDSEKLKAALAAFGNATGEITKLISSDSYSRFVSQVEDPAFAAKGLTAKVQDKPVGDQLSILKEIINSRDPVDIPNTTQSAIKTEARAMVSKLEKQVIGPFISSITENKSPQEALAILAKVIKGTTLIDTPNVDIEKVKDAAQKLYNTIESKMIVKDLNTLIKDMPPKEALAALETVMNGTHRLDLPGVNIKIIKEEANNLHKSISDKTNHDDYDATFEAIQKALRGAKTPMDKVKILTEIANKPEMLKGDFLDSGVKQEARRLISVYVDKVVPDIPINKPEKMEGFINTFKAATSKWYGTGNDDMKVLNSALKELATICKKPEPKTKEGREALEIQRFEALAKVQEAAQFFVDHDKAMLGDNEKKTGKISTKYEFVEALLNKVKAVHPPDSYAKSETGLTAKGNEVVSKVFNQAITNPDKIESILNHSVQFDHFAAFCQAQTVTSFDPAGKEVEVNEGYGKLTDFLKDFKIAMEKQPPDKDSLKELVDKHFKDTGVNINPNILMNINYNLGRGDLAGAIKTIGEEALKVKDKLMTEVLPLYLDNAGQQEDRHNIVAKANLENKMGWD